MGRKTSKVLVAMIVLSLLVNVLDGLSWGCILTGLGAGVVSVVAAHFVLTAVGFTATDVAAGSMAAVVQSGIGHVVAGSTFAAFQFAGTAGLATTTKVAIGATVGTVFGSATCTDNSITC